MAYFTILNSYKIIFFYVGSLATWIQNLPFRIYVFITKLFLQIDSKFTTTTQIVKLVNSHMISRISLRIGDIKRSKMVRTINFYYNNRTVQAVQELKNRPGNYESYSSTLKFNLNLTSSEPSG